MGDGIDPDPEQFVGRIAVALAASANRAAHRIAMASIHASSREFNRHRRACR
jgi:hypothetical protein